MSNNSNKVVLNIRPAGSVRDINNREDLSFICQDQEVEELKYFLIGDNNILLDQLKDIQSFFMDISEGGITELYGIESDIPDLSRTLYQIKVLFNDDIIHG